MHTNLLIKGVIYHSRTLNIDAKDRTTGQIELSSWDIIFASPGRLVSVEATMNPEPALKHVDASTCFTGMCLVSKHSQTRTTGQKDIEYTRYFVARCRPIVVSSSRVP